LKKSEVKKFELESLNKVLKTGIHQSFNPYKKTKGPEWKFSPVFKIQYPMKNRDKNTTI
jgi:hypothetical protein